MKIEIGSKAATLEEEVTVENVIDSSLELLQRWAALYFPSSPDLAEDLVAETKLHVLKLHRDGCLQGNPAYGLYLSQHEADSDAEEKLNAQLVLATMESVLYHHFISPSETNSRSYANANLFVDHALREQQIESGSLQRASDIFYFVTGRKLNGIEPSPVIDLDEKMYEAESDPTPVTIVSTRQLKAHYRKKEGAGKKTIVHHEDSAQGIKHFARKKFGFGKQMAARVYAYGESLDLSPDEHRDLIKMVKSDPTILTGVKDGYKQIAQSRR